MWAKTFSSWLLYYKTMSVSLGWVTFPPTSSGNDFELWIGEAYIDNTCYEPTVCLLLLVTIVIILMNKALTFSKFKVVL